MDDYITCKTGEEIYGVFAMKPNKQNNVSASRDCSPTENIGFLCLSPFLVSVEFSSVGQKSALGSGNLRAFVLPCDVTRCKHKGRVLHQNDSFRNCCTLVLIHGAHPRRELGGAR